MITAFEEPSNAIIYIYDTHTGKQLVRFDAGQVSGCDPNYGASFSDQDRIIITGTIGTWKDTGHIFAWDSATGKKLYEVEGGPFSGFIDTNEHGRRMAANPSVDYTLIFNTQTGELEKKIKTSSYRTNISPDDKYLASCGFMSPEPYGVYVIDSGEKLNLPEYECTSIAFSPEGKWLAVGNSKYDITGQREFEDKTEEIFFVNYKTGKTGIHIRGESYVSLFIKDQYAGLRQNRI